MSDPVTILRNFEGQPISQLSDEALIALATIQRGLAAGSSVLEESQQQQIYVDGVVPTFSNKQPPPVVRGV